MTLTDTDDFGDTDDSDGVFHVGLEVPDRDAFVKLAREIAFTDEGYALKSVTRTPELNENVVTVDLVRMTEKQRLTMIRALELGYYQRPREVDIGAVADELDITRSAVSQRLRAAESNLVRSTFERFI